MSTTSTSSNESERTAHRILVGVDGSEDSTRALEWAAKEAVRAGALLEILAAWEPGYEFITPKEVGETLERIVNDATQRAKEIAPGIVTIGTTHEGSPAAVLIAGSEGADLLVVGSRGLGGFRGLLLGSVGLKCASHAMCPTVIVR